MYKIVDKKKLNQNVSMMEIECPLISTHANPGQFVIVRSHNDSERIPLTIHDYDVNKKTIKIIYQIVGEGTQLLDTLNIGDNLNSLVGPLGEKTHFEEYNNICIIGGGVGCAISFPIVKKATLLNKDVTSICGFRNKENVILEEEFNNACTKNYIVTDDGSYKEKMLVTDKLEELLKDDTFDLVIAIGPLPMMKYVSLLTKKHNIKTIVSMNPIMIDGTGMCGGCRLTVDGKVKFACIDGPDFDGHLVDFDEAIKRSKMYSSFEKHRYEKTCNLLNGGKHE